MKNIAFALLAAIALLENNFAWDNTGHEAVVAIALQREPSLRPRLEKILKDLPKNQDWKNLKKTGLIPNNPVHHQTEKSDPTGWVKALANNPEKAATFADWARDYKGYKPAQYDLWHFYDTDFDNVDDTRFVQHPNALEKLPDLENALTNGTGQERAWALVWLLHLVGDLHQPLHCTSRILPGTNKGDRGGNDVTYNSSNLHSYWDHLPDTRVKPDPDMYAAHIASILASDPVVNNEINTEGQDLDPAHWVRQGHDIIHKIGYPADQKVAKYSFEAHALAETQLWVAGARLANILKRDLPPN